MDDLHGVLNTEIHRKHANAYLRHAASEHQPIETSRLGAHREHRRVRCSP
jgi:hypothetical protein